MKLKQITIKSSFFAEESQAFKSESSVQDEDVTDQSDDENNRDKKETFKVSDFTEKNHCNVYIFN